MSILKPTSHEALTHRRTNLSNHHKLKPPNVPKENNPQCTHKRCREQDGLPTTRMGSAMTGSARTRLKGYREPQTAVVSSVCSDIFSKKIVKPQFLFRERVPFPDTKRVLHKTWRGYRGTVISVELANWIRPQQIPSHFPSFTRCVAFLCVCVGTHFDTRRDLAQFTRGWRCVSDGENKSAPLQ